LDRTFSALGVVALHEPGVVLAINLIGEGLNDTLNPRLRNR
jgi:hypothetical protein